MQDYPAAHSMDTDWFAVDVEGNLGFFSSSEGGAVPHNAHGMYLEEFISELPTDERGILHLAIDGKVVADEADLDGLWESIHFGRTIHDVLLVLASEDVIEELMPYVKWRFSGVEVVVFVQECADNKVQRLIESGKILRGKPWFEPFSNAGVLGLFPYYCNCQFAIPYEQLDRPIAPLKFDSLSSEFQQKIAPVRFDSLRFSEAKEIQPIEHIRCNTWGGTQWWLDTQGQEHETHPDYNSY
ncbi:MAG: hypothetical protein KME17_18465 [Cyanosarcina radialis HA8281-LM2]|jgi:hypothetical protein|nr:hypothetical protein [Cyanosarcina radialis HA8281-LM2]